MQFRVVRRTVFPHAPEEMIPEEQRILDAVGAKLISATCNTAADVGAAVRGAHAVILTGVPVTAEAMDAMPECRGIVCPSIGFDHVDLAAATARGIKVANVPDFCVREVANHTMGLILACARKIVSLNNALHSGRWDRTMIHPMSPIYGETLGLVSFGRIARQVAIRAKAFDLNVIAYDPYVNPGAAAEYGVDLVPLDEVLRRSDFVSIHVPGGPATYHMIGERELALMKPTAMIFNTGRGGVIDEVALADALRAGRLAGVGLDVFEREPMPPDHPLIGLENVVMTPHAAGYSVESIRTVRRRAAEEVVRILRGDMPQNLVNTDVATA
jgi:D-3-phosphoglycerate dehydrogenase